MSARTDLVALLSAALPIGWQVDGVFVQPDELEVDVARLLVEETTIKPGGSWGLRQHTFVLWLLDEHTDPEAVAESLDARIGVLLGILDALPVLAWTDAERGDLRGIFPAFRVTVTTQHTKG